MARNKQKWIPVSDGAFYRKPKNSHTPGSQKGENCLASPIKKLLCKSRAYKRPEYNRWDELFGIYWK